MIVVTFYTLIWLFILLGNRDVSKTIGKTVFILPLLLSWVIGYTIAQETRHPVPKPDELKSFAGKSEQLFSAEFKAKDFETQKLLVDQLATKSQSDTIEPDEQYYFLSEALRVATLNADASSALYVIDQLDSRFAVDFWGLAGEATKQIAKKAKTPEQLESAKRTIDQLTNQAILDEEYSIARLLISRSMTVTRKLGRSEELDSFKKLKSEIGDLEKLSKYGRIAFAKLADSPDDQKANLSRGNYLVFVKADFENGFKHWLVSDDDTWSKIAKAELSYDSATANADVELADMWLEASAQLNGTKLKSALRRALHWYSKALEGVVVSDRVEISGKVNALKRSLGILTKVKQEVLDPNLVEPVELALQWIVKHQLPDGGWSFDHTIGPGEFRKTSGVGELNEARNGATGLALMTLVKSGHTHKTGMYKNEVLKAVEFLAKRGRRVKSVISFNEPGGTMYSHGIVTQALFELYQQTKDKNVLRLAQGAIVYIQQSQDPVGGGWRYAPRQPGDTSVTCWQLRAIGLAKNSGVVVDPRTLALAMKFLDSVNSADRLSYGYTSPPRNKFSSRTPNGLLSRLEAGWDNKHPEFLASSKTITDHGPSKSDAYFNFHGTLLMKKHGGPEWVQWRTKLHDELIPMQAKTGNETGSWLYKSSNHSSQKGGRLFTTAFCTMILLEN